MRTVLRRRRRFNKFDRPYVLWTLRDGSLVLANRHYWPIAEGRRGGIGHVIERWRWFDDIAEERWIQTPEFRTLTECRRWSDDILWRFLDGKDMRPVLQAHPGKRHTATGEKIVERSAPREWPPAWPAGPRLGSEPGLRVLQARIIPLGPFPTPPDATLL